MKKVYILFILLYASSLLALGSNNGWEPATKKDFMKLYNNAMEWYLKTKQINVSITYATFSDHKTLTSYEMSTGSYLKNGNMSLSSVLGIKTIVNERYFFMIDTTEKIIVINNYQPGNQTSALNKTFESMMDNVKSFSRQESINGNTIYRIEFNPNALYSSLTIEFNNNGHVTKEVFYYSTELKEESDESDEYGNMNKSSLVGKPRLEISFHNYQSVLSQAQIASFTEKIYFREEGKKIILTNKYKNYELIDNRFNLSNK